MKSSPIVSNALGRVLSSGQSIVQLNGKEPWLASLNVGQILKGRIMRQYGDGRYGIHFSGQERIVDSAVPLSVGDVLSGRVVGVSENLVSIQLVRGDQSSSTDNSAEKLPNPLPGNSASLPVAVALMEQTRIHLDPSMLTMVATVAEEFENPAMVIKIGLYLAKLGLPLSKELVRAMSSRVLDAQAFARQQVSEDVSNLASEPTGVACESGVQQQAAVIEYLAKYFSEYRSGHQNGDQERDVDVSPFDLSAEDSVVPSVKQKTYSFRDGQPEGNPLLSSLLSQVINIQTGATYQHRFETLPIIVNGRVMEFDIALFDHSPDAASISSVRKRHFKFSLNTQLGTVVLDAHVLNNHVHFLLTAESEWVANEFEQYHADLCDSLAPAGWQLDVAEYRSDSKSDSPAAAVIEHVLAQDSLQMTF